MADIENEDTQGEAPSELPGMDEKKVLMDRAKMMGLKFSPNIGLETLRAKLKAYMEAAEKAEPAEGEDTTDEEPETQTEDAPPAMRANVTVKPKVETKNELRKRLSKESLRLVRVRLTCLNPSKKDLPGEIYTVANKYIGTVRKYVPFGDQTENGYHIPHCLFEHLKERKFQHIRTLKGPRGEIIVKTSDVAEFAIEILPQLTKAELTKLAQRQAMAKGTADDNDTVRDES